MLAGSFVMLESVPQERGVCRRSVSKLVLNIRDLFRLFVVINQRPEEKERKKNVFLLVSVSVFI